VRRIRVVGGVVAVVLLVVAAILAATWLGGDNGSRQTLPTLTPTADISVSPRPVAQSRLVTAANRACTPVARRPFVPVSVTVGGLGAHAVLAMGREASGATGTPPLTSAGKQQFAWDAPGVRPGAQHGNVLLNAHTWPDGSALGNHLLGALQGGDLIAVSGAQGQRLCYRVTARVEVPFDASGSRYYDDAGRPQVAIAVCSGTRLGPGVWTHRTLWFASPVSR
jgi:hypothetical protein